jgi:hypothetical protein
MPHRIVPLIVATIVILCPDQNAAYAQGAAPVKVTASSGTKLCLKSKSGAIAPKAKCGRGEVTFSANSYKKEIQKVSDNLDTLATTVDSIPLPNLVIDVAPSGTLVKTIPNAIALAKYMSPSASSPVLIRLGPGTYSLPTDGITLPSYVALEGSGIGTTVLEASGAAAVSLSDNSRIGHLSVTSSPTASAYLIGSSSAGGPSFVHDVEVSAQGSTSSSSGIAGLRAFAGTFYVDRARVRLSNSPGFASGVIAGGSSTILRASHLDIESTGKTPQGLVLHDNSDSTITDSRIEARSTASDGVGNPIRIDHASTKVLIKNSFITATTVTMNNEAIFVTTATDVTLDSCRVRSTPGTPGSGLGVIDAAAGAKVKIFNSTIETDVTSISSGAYEAGSEIRFANSILGGGPIAQVSGGAILCAGVTDENFVFFSAPCPN